MELSLLMSLVFVLLEFTFTYASIVSPPQSLNTTLGSTATFNCVVLNAQAIYWTINGSLSDLFNDVETEVNQKPGSNALESVLLVPTVMELNDSNVTCNAVVNGIVQSSDPVLLLIQGILDAVNNITIEITESTLVTVQWSPPYSLDNVPIVNYTLLLTGLLSDYSMIHVSTQLSHVFTLPNLCDRYVLTITPSNDAGDGISNTIDVYKLPAAQITPESVQVSVYISKQEGNPVAEISYNVSHNCSIPLVHYANIAISDSNNRLLIYGPYYTNSSHDVINVTLDTLEHDTLYHMTLSDQIVGGVSNAVAIEISSYDVQNVTIVTDDDGVLCVTCHFISGSQAGGCVVELSVIDQSLDYLSVHLSRTESEQAITGCIKHLIPAEYTIEVYDVEKDGVKLFGAEPAIVFDSVIITRPPVVMPSTTTITDTSRTLGERTVSISPSQTLTNRNAALAAANITYRNSAIGVGVVIIVIIVVLVLLIIIQVRKLKQRRKQLKEGIIAESSDIAHLRTQSSSDTTTTTTATTATSSTSSPLIETVSHDSEAPPPPPPPLTMFVPPQLPTSSSGIDTTSTDLPSPGADSVTSLLRTDRRDNMPRPSSYHELQNITSSRRNTNNHPNRTHHSSLRSNRAMTAWAAVNPLTLPVLPEAPPPYNEVDRESSSYQRPQSALLPSSSGDTSSIIASSIVSEVMTRGRHPTEYVSLHFTRDKESSSNNRHSLPSGSTGVQYAIISSSNAYLSHNDSHTNVINSLV